MATEFTGMRQDGAMTSTRTATRGGAAMLAGIEQRLRATTGDGDCTVRFARPGVATWAVNA